MNKSLVALTLIWWLTVVSTMGDVNTAILSLNEGMRIQGATALDYAGYSISYAGDFNGDGFDDIIIGSTDADPLGRTNAGIAYLVFDTIDTFTMVDHTYTCLIFILTT